MELPNVTNVEESILINIKYLNMTHYTDNNQKQHKEQLEEALKKNKTEQEKYAELMEMKTNMFVGAMLLKCRR